MASSRNRHNDLPRRTRSVRDQGSDIVIAGPYLLLPDSQSKSFRCSGNAAGFSSTEFRQVQRLIVSPLSNEATRDHPVCRLPCRVSGVGEYAGLVKVYFKKKKKDQVSQTYGPDSFRHASWRTGAGVRPEAAFSRSVNWLSVAYYGSSPKIAIRSAKNRAIHHHPCRCSVCTRTSIWALWPPASAPASVFAYF